MLGRQEEEPDKALMCEYGIWREFRRVVSSGHSKVCSTERGGSKPQCGQSRGIG